MKLRLLFTPMGRRQIDAVAGGMRRGSACTCDPKYFPVACDVECPEHGLASFLRERLKGDSQRGGEAA